MSFFFKSKNAFQEGDLRRANDRANTARNLIFVSVVIGVIGIVAVVVTYCI